MKNKTRQIYLQQNIIQLLKIKFMLDNDDDFPNLPESPYDDEDWEDDEGE